MNQKFYHTLLRQFLLCFCLFAGFLQAYGQAPTITSFTPTSGSIGTLITVTGTNLESVSSAAVGGKTAIVVNKSATQAQLLLMPGTLGGTVTVTVTGNASASSTGSFNVVASVPPAVQQGGGLLGTGAVGDAQQGISVAVSADGNTAIVGGHRDNFNTGAVWIYTRIGSTWAQQGNKLVGTGIVNVAQQGYSVALSADGNTALVGGPADNNNFGAAWVFVRVGSTWAQQGAKLVGTGSVGNGNQGNSVSLSADGNTAIVGGPTDNGKVGAAWVFTRSGSTWAQQGSKLVGIGAVGNANQGYSVSVSADGNTTLLGGPEDNNRSGASWVFARTDSVWAQQGSKLVGTGASSRAALGNAVALSADGNTAIVGSPDDYSPTGSGAAWIYTRNRGLWTQQGSKLVGTGGTLFRYGVIYGDQGTSVALSADGNTAIVGGPEDGFSRGSVWIFARVGVTWAQQGIKRSFTENGGVGISVALSADGNTAIVGGQLANANKGAAWVLNGALPIPTITNFTPTSGTPGSVVDGTMGTMITITGTNFFNVIKVLFGGKDAWYISVINPTTITAAMGPGTPSGALTIQVITPGGTATSTNTITSGDTTSGDPFGKYLDSYELGPNPTDDYIAVMVSPRMNFDLRLEIIDPTGKLISQSTYSVLNGLKRLCILELDALSGIYFVRATDQTTGEVIRTDRILKQ
jgi:hypothetical protein